MISSGFRWAAVALTAVVASVGVTVMQANRLRAQIAQEQRLVERGTQIRNAIARYYDVNEDEWPSDLSQLTAAARPGAALLASVPPDPIAGQEWRVVRNTHGGIVGVHSASSKVASGYVVPPGHSAETVPQSYSDWRFVYAPPTRRASLPPARGAERRQVATQTLAPPQVQQIPAERAAGQAPKPAIVPAAAAPRRSPTLCATLQRSDENSCATVEARSGVHPATICRASALERASACTTQPGTTALPPLVLASPAGDI